MIWTTGWGEVAEVDLALSRGRGRVGGAASFGVGPRPRPAGESGPGGACEAAIDYHTGSARCRIGLGKGWRMSANIIRELRNNPDVTDCVLEY